MVKIVGGCSCGKVRYSAEAEPIFQGLCHCTSCQRASGSSYSPVVAIPAPSLTVTGELKHYESKGDSGKPRQHGFCPNCGSPVTGTGDIMPGVVMLTAGTLDDQSWFKPTMQIYCDSKMPWVELGGGIPAFPKMPG